MRIAVVGLGLIGGSLAKSIRRHSPHAVFGYDIDRDTITEAMRCESIDDELTDELLPECDIVLIALYPSLCVDYIRDHASLFGENAVIIDCAGVKRSVCNPIYDIRNGHSWTYIGGHPMAGREFSGFNYALDNLFEKHSMILTPDPTIPENTMVMLHDFFLEIGFGSVHVTTPQEHDSMISYTSQLAHIVSGAYVKNPLALSHKGFSAGSFRDMTRVARLNEDMWTELFMDNADLLVPSIDDFIFRMEQYKEALSSKDADTLKALLREGRIKKEALD